MLNLFKLISFVLSLLWASYLQAASIAVTINAGGSTTSIPSQTYGSNAVITGVNNPYYRQGGNRMTGYNWDNNSSNGGADYCQSSGSTICSHEDWYMVPTGVTAPGMPATTLTDFIQANNAVTADSLVTLQIAGYVAANGACNCFVTITAPSDTSNTYWDAVSFSGGPTTGSPVTNGTIVYMNEEMYYLVNTVGYAGSGGAKFYDLDNEPAIWNSSHPMLHPAQPTCAEVSSKGISLATVITSIDPNAQILGPVAYGWSEYVNNQSAPDDSVLTAYNNGDGISYLNYYLAQMQSASTTTNRRLLDYLDLHWYPEATGVDGGTAVRIVNDDTTYGVAVARMQAPRSLWDPTYEETSWIESSIGGPISLIPRLQSAVNQYYPGTGYSFSEYQYGSGEDISGGVAEADVLGLFGQYGAIACWWPDTSNPGTTDTYMKAAFNMYLNYDGAGSKYGNLALPVSYPSASVTYGSAYASRNNSIPNKLWVIAVDRDCPASVSGGVTYSQPTTDTGSFTLTNLSSGQTITGIRAFRFDANDSALYNSSASVTLGATSFSDYLPGRSGTLYEITLANPFITFTPTKTGTPTPSATNSPTNTPTTTGTLPTSTYTLTNTATSTPTLSPTITLSPTSTPLGCNVIFNSCQSLTANGTWAPTNASVSLSTLNAPYGTYSLDFDVTTMPAGGWNAGIMNLTNFTPNVWTGIGQMIFDITVDPNLTVGATYTQLFLRVDSSSAGLYNQSIANDVGIQSGSQSVTFNINYALSGGLVPSDVLSEIYIIYNSNSTNGTGHFYLDDIQLNTSPCPWTATPSPTNSATNSATSTTTNSPTNSQTATPTNSPTSTPTPSSTFTPTNSDTPCMVGGVPCTSTITFTPSATQTNSPTATLTLTPTLTFTSSSTSTTTMTPTATFSYTFTSTPTLTTTHTATQSPTSTSTPAMVNLLYPNPITGNQPLNFQYNINLPTDQVEVKIFTLAFRKIYEDDTLPSAFGQHSYRLDWGSRGLSVANGLYYVLLYWKEGAQETHQVMKLLIQR